MEAVAVDGPPMTVDELLSGAPVLRAARTEGLRPAGVTHDSRGVRPGNAFVAVRGLKEDGLAHAPAAVRVGASLVVVGRGRFEEAERLLASLPAARHERPVGLVEVEDERIALALMSRNSAGRPDLEMRITGITGTNGKTTSSHLLASMLEAGGTRCGLVGTVEYRLGGEVLRAGRTTPEAADLCPYLRRMRDAGAGACVMEVSSHALDLRRVEGIRFAAGVFTNLTRDHLDYHGDMESYFAAKRRLFDGMEAEAPAILNADDPYGRRLAAEIGQRVVLYGMAEDAGFRIAGREEAMEGLTVRIEAEGARREIHSPLIGRPNAYNVTAAAAAARALGVPWEAIREGAARTDRIPGRLESVRAGQPFAVLVDYAHTDDALRSVLETLRALTRGRLIVVFGAGGDRDRSKRPLMGEHAARLADLAWLTSDNPRSEDPLAIIDMVLEGVRTVPEGAARCRVEPDRAAAIAAAIREARDGDTVLIAGKGHEREQILAGRVVPFDDADVARRLIEERFGTERDGAGPDAG
jgi:UDP-N-acetylmuramoyl-L-alanyl-D-glutamate--2,6-diaminopimelate ligase